MRRELVLNILPFMAVLNLIVLLSCSVVCSGFDREQKSLVPDAYFYWPMSDLDRLAQCSSVLLVTVADAANSSEVDDSLSAGIVTRRVLINDVETDGTIVYQYAAALHEYSLSEDDTHAGVKKERVRLVWHQPMRDRIGDSAPVLQTWESTSVTGSTMSIPFADGRYLVFGDWSQNGELALPPSLAGYMLLGASEKEFAPVWVTRVADDFVFPDNLRDRSALSLGTLLLTATNLNDFAPPFQRVLSATWSGVPSNEVQNYKGQLESVLLSQENYVLRGLIFALLGRLGDGERVVEFFRVLRLTSEKPEENLGVRGRDGQWTSIWRTKWGASILGQIQFYSVFTDNDILPVHNEALAEILFESTSAETKAVSVFYVSRLPDWVTKAKLLDLLTFTDPLWQLNAAAIPSEISQQSCYAHRIMVMLAHWFDRPDLSTNSDRLRPSKPDTPEGFRDDLYDEWIRILSEPER